MFISLFCLSFIFANFFGFVIVVVVLLFFHLTFFLFNLICFVYLRVSLYLFSFFTYFNKSWFSILFHFIKKKFVFIPSDFLLKCLNSDFISGAVFRCLLFSFFYQILLTTATSLINKSLYKKLIQLHSRQGNTSITGS